MRDEQNQAPVNGSSDQLVRISGRAPAEVCASLELSEESIALLAENPQPTPFLTALLKGGHYMDAVHFLANAFDNRDGVAWACRCVRHIASEPLPPEQEAAVLSAEAWVKEFNQDACDQAALAAEAAGMDTMAGLAALAAQMSGQSMSRPDLPVVPPPAGIAQLVVAGAVLTAVATIEDPEEVENRYKACLALGIEIAKQPSTEALGAG